MRPLFQGEGCAINEAGISSAGNPLTRAFDAVTNDPLHARQMREGYLNGARPPMGGLGMQGRMLDPMMGKPGGALERAWQDVGAMHGPPMPMGPALGAAMPDQLMRHMQRPAGPGMAEAGFFTDGPSVMPGLGGRVRRAACRAEARDDAAEAARPRPRLGHGVPRAATCATSAGRHGGGIPAGGLPTGGSCRVLVLVDGGPGHGAAHGSGHGADGAGDDEPDDDGARTHAGGATSHDGGARRPCAGPAGRRKRGGVGPSASGRGGADGGCLEGG